MPSGGGGDHDHHQIDGVQIDIQRSQIVGLGRRRFGAQDFLGLSLAGAYLSVYLCVAATSVVSPVRCLPSAADSLVHHVVATHALPLRFGGMFRGCDAVRLQSHHRGT